MSRTRQEAVGVFRFLTGAAPKVAEIMSMRCPRTSRQLLTDVGQLRIEVQAVLFRLVQDEEALTQFFDETCFVAAPDVTVRAVCGSARQDGR